jgi:riboflavin kinase/FMN adenylyltransferase
MDLKMQVFNEIPEVSNSIITIGSFDGLHLGHQNLLQFMKSEALKRGLIDYVITFDPHPRTVLKNYNSFHLINDPKEKIKLFEEKGIERIVNIPFNLDFSNKSAEDFAMELIQKMKPKAIVIGYDHKFGHDRKGSKETFIEISKKLNLDIEILQFEEFKTELEKINSTEIRKHIELGEIKQANVLLGYDFFYIGVVIKGKQIGRTIQFPTANILIQHKFKIIPKFGVYKSNVIVNGKKYESITNIGIKPTFEDTLTNIETYIFDFDQDIYGQEIRVALIDFIRPEQKFENLDALQYQIAEDIKYCKSFDF